MRTIYSLISLTFILTAMLLTPAELRGVDLRNGDAVRQNVKLEREATSRELYAEAMREYRSSNYTEARMLLQKALNTDPNNRDAQTLLARVQEEYGSKEGSIAAATMQMSRQRRIAVEASLVELHNLLDQAQQQLDAYSRLGSVSRHVNIESLLAKQLELLMDARDKLDRADERVKWMPFDVDVQQESKELALLRRKVEAKISKTKLSISEVRKRIAADKVMKAQQNIENIARTKINTIMDQAWVFYDKGEFQKAGSLASEVLRQDPSNKDALVLRKKARNAKFMNDEREIKRDMRYQSARIWLDMDRVSTPIRDYIVFPKDWAEKQTRRNMSGQTSTEAPQWKRNIQQALTKPVSFQFQDQTLREAVDFLASLTKVAFVLDPGVIDAGLDSTPVTLRVDDMTAEDALKWVLRFADLDYNIQDQAVYVFQPESVARKMTLEIYDIRDVTYVKPGFRGPLIESVIMQNDNSSGFASADQEGIVLSDISDLIQQFVEPASWALDGATIEAHEGTGKLFVMQTEEVHQKIRSFLARLRERQIVQVGIQVRFIEVRNNFLNEVGIHFTGLDSYYATGGVMNTPLPHGVEGANPDLNVARNTRDFDSRGDTISLVGGTAPVIAGDNQLQLRFSPYHTTAPSAAYGMRDYLGRSLALGESVPRVRINPLASQTSFGNLVYGATGGQPAQGLFLQYRYFGSMAANAILHALAKDQTADQLNAPRLTVFNNQSAYVLVGLENAYIRDFQVSGDVYDPVVGNYLTGSVLNVRPVVSHDRRYVTMEIEPGVAGLRQLRTLPLASPSGTVFLELPDMNVRSVRTMATVPDRGSLLLSGMIIDNRADMQTGIPLLMHIPILGRLFSTHYEERERQNLLVMVTTRIILFEEEEAKAFH